MTLKNQQEKHIDKVGVDSGQLIICDPCYIDSEWTKEDFINIGGRFRDKAGKTYEYPKDFPNFEHVLPSGKTPNQHIESGDWKRVPVPEQVAARGRFSYAGACEATLSDKLSHAKSVAFRLGHGRQKFIPMVELNTIVLNLINSVWKINSVALKHTSLTTQN